MQVYLTPEQAEKLNIPYGGSGGRQSLNASLLRSRDGLVQNLDEVQCERVVRYFVKYGQGGFQERIRPLAEALMAEAS